MRKAQFSIEFLFTYGWALLIITVITGAIYTFGWLDFSMLMPEKCDFFAQVECEEFYVQVNGPPGTADDSITLILNNDFNADLVLRNVTIADPTGTLQCDAISPSVDTGWDIGESITVNLTECQGQKFEKRVTLDAFVTVHFYNNETCPNGPSNCVYTSKGVLQARVN
ncbi:MAG: hypothetical protein ACOCWQ_02905 [Nanoarchaeota archaeon]